VRSFVSPLVLAFLVVLFGALWGAAEGFWLVAPEIVDAHRILPRTINEWLVLESIVLAGSAGLGTVFALPAGFIVLAWLASRRADRHRVQWTLALALGPLVAIAYVVAALTIERIYFGRFPVAAMTAAATICAALAAASALAHRTLTRDSNRAPVSRLAGVLIVVIALGSVTLPYRVLSAPATSPVDGGPLQRRSSEPAQPPLLFVGIDSGNWETLAPLMTRGSLPTFSRLVGEGIHGDIAALWPPYWSGPAWAAILTGHPRDETGVYADLTIQAPGLPPFDAPLDSNVVLDPFLLVEWHLLGRDAIRATHPPRTVLRRPPVWELLAAAGVESAVVRFDFTYPARDQAAFVVSNRVGHDTWEVARVRDGEGGDVVSPAAVAPELLAPFSEEVSPDADLQSRVLAGSHPPRTAHQTLELDMLKTALDIDTRTLDASQRILRLRPDIPFMAVYLGGFDNACHAFWEYRFPDAYGDTRPAADDVAAFSGVIDRYLEFLDAGLAKLLAAYGTPPNVVLVSDHGHTAVLDHPLWRGWHGPLGMFIAAGPAFRHDERPLTVSYYDVVPTLADAVGLAVPDGMHGVSLIANH
jgi:hypothetical protein